jgi:hypothetical protein
MSAIADFTVTVLDCRSCAGRFIESHVALSLHAEHIVCPHCSAPFQPRSGEEACSDGDPAAHPVRHSRAAVHFSGSRRRKLQ